MCQNNIFMLVYNNDVRFAFYDSLEMDLKRVKNEEKLELCRKYYQGMEHFLEIV